MYVQVVLYINAHVRKVSFVGESGLDFGGLRREFFTLFTSAASDALLQGSKKKFFTNNVLAIQVNEKPRRIIICLQMQQFYHLGVYIAMSIMCRGVMAFLFLPKQCTIRDNI